MSRRNKRPASELYPPKTITGCDALVRLWMLRILVPLGGTREFIHDGGIHDEDTIRFLGLYELLNEEDAEARDNLPPRAILAALRTLHQQQEELAHNSPPPVPANLINNCQMLGELLSLSEIEKQILMFAVLVRIEPKLHDCGCLLGSRITSLRLIHILSVVLGSREEVIKEAMSRHGTLAVTGLVSGPSSGVGDLDDKLDLLSRDFADTMLGEIRDPVELFRGLLMLAEPGHLHDEDFLHIRDDLDVLIPYLKHALTTRRKGVNILLFGLPGTGKTQLARLLAEVLNAKLFEVPSEDGDGDPIKPTLRLRALRTGQAVVDGRQALLLFDEIEDVFSDGGFFGAPSTAQTHKAWINQTLETAPVPTIWLSNNIRQMDPAFIRRFDMLIEMPIPPVSTRRRIIERATEGLLSQTSIERITRAEKLAPAIITRAASVIRSIQTELHPEQLASALERLVNHTLQAQGHDTLSQNEASSLPAYYDPAFINSSEELTELAQGLRNTRSGRLCLYGPPGTGKSAFGRWLADELAMPLLIKRASDIISKWVGGTEKNLAQAFREAEEEGALLLIDEVDSFLQDRRHAARSWEVTGVNEMLTQMESFSGVFIASTNLVEGLDPASLRRFDLKLKFDYLRYEQAWELFVRQSHALALPAPDTALRSQLKMLTQLTPGDFAAVARQHRFRPFKDAGHVLRALEEEHLLKDAPPRATIGFI